MKKLTIAMISIFTLFTPVSADFTIKDLFTSGGVEEPVESKDKEKKDHDCQ